jgi:hypothetical protein
MKADNTIVEFMIRMLELVPYQLLKKFSLCDIIYVIVYEVFTEGLNKGNNNLIKGAKIRYE